MIDKKIDYKVIPKDSGEFLELVDFAEEFDHKVVDHPQVNVIGHYKNGKLFGYSDHVFVPVIYPAFHPAHTTPRDVMQCMHDLRVFAQVSGTAGYIGVPIQEDRKTFTNDIMDKLGFIRTRREIYAL
jgi:hypothetical protein